MNLRHHSLCTEHVLSHLQLLLILNSKLQIFITLINCIFRNAQESLLAQLKYRSGLSNNLWFHLLFEYINIENPYVAVDSVWIQRF